MTRSVNKNVFVRGGATLSSEQGLNGLKADLGNSSDQSGVRSDGFSHLDTDEPLLAKTAKRIEQGLPGYSAEPVEGMTYHSWTGHNIDVIDGRPILPDLGRDVKRPTTTGLGSCSFWGPNHAADSIVTRDGQDGSTQILLIQRGDTGDWALPGGKLDQGETSSGAASRELSEETGLSVNFSEVNTAYKGYVNDPRNTQNAWFETTAIHAHLTGDAAQQEPKNGDDADDARWVTLTPEVLSNLYADHAKMVDAAMTSKT